MIRKIDAQKSANVSRDIDKTSEPNREITEKRQVADQIGRQLRGMYDGILNQPVPDRFLDLVRQLEGGSATRANDK
jgi:hypothetical protein